mgnify:CR=1 FL=1
MSTSAGTAGVNPYLLNLYQNPAAAQITPDGLSMPNLVPFSAAANPQTQVPTQVPVSSAAAFAAAAQAAAQAAQAAALGRYRLVNAWFYPRGDWYTFYWDGSSADKVARRATYPTLEHDDHDPGPLAERIRRDKREASHRSSDDSSSDRDSCGTGSTSEANDIFDTLEDHLGYGSDSGSGW